MKILIVEDDANLRSQLAEGLDKAGFQCQLAADGLEGYFQASEYPYDMAIIDLGLPKIDGIELIRRLRKDGCAFPLLILTARGGWKAKVEGLEAGADDYIVKPFNLELLLVRIKAVISRSQRGTSISHRRRSGTFKFSSWEFKLESSRLSTQNGFEISLSRKEIALLFAFLSN